MRRLKNWLRSYLDYTEVSEAPPKFHFWAGVSTLAGALRRKVWLDMGHFAWTPNFYIFLIAAPGVAKKSTTTHIGMKLLRNIEGVKFGPKSVTWQALVDALQFAQMDWAPQGINGTLYPMSCVTIEASELGTFFDPQNREMTDVLVDLYDGKEESWLRRTRQEGEKEIQNPWVNIIGCTTPAWLAEYTNAAHFVKGGFASRVIFVYAETKHRLIAHPKKVMPRNIGELRGDLIADLQEISSLFGEYELTAEGDEWGERWYTELNRNPPASLRGDLFGGYLDRKQTHVYKLAMVLSAAKRGDFKITREDLFEANEALSDLEPDLPIIFSHQRAEPVAGLASAIFRIVQIEGPLTRTELFRHFWRDVGYETFDAAITALVNTGLVDLNAGPPAQILVNQEAAKKAGL